VCLDELEGLADGTVAAQKILSCVARAGERFGAEHIVDVLLGAHTERVRRWRHEQLSTYGLMKGTNRKALTNMVYQLMDAGLLARTPDDRPVLRLTEASWAVLRGQRSVRLLQAKKDVSKTRVEAASWAGVDSGLFDSLRALRRTLADARGVPPYVLFSDATLRDMARARPGSAAAFICVRGVGQRKLADLGPAFLKHIADYCREHGLTLDAALGSRPRRVVDRPHASQQAAFDMFAKGCNVQQVMTALDRAESTTWGYLTEFVATTHPPDLEPWVDQQTYRTVAQAIEEIGSLYVKPLYDHLGGRVPYHHIRLVVAHVQDTEASTAG
jgi:ATP-dependent DNA helicase RecQ